MLDAARSTLGKFPAWRDLDLQELKDELATKFVVGLGRVREIFIVYWREFGEDERV